MKRYVTIFVSLLLCFSLSAQEFESMEYNGTLYQEFACNTIENQSPALIIYLHSRHASGNDNKRQLSQAGVQEIAKYINENHLSSFFIVPQCPNENEWVGRDGIPGYSKNVEDLINFYLNTKNIDASRIYICGASMGACGVWKLLKDNPDLFTAAFIASGQAHRANPSDFTRIPLYVTVGSEERSYAALKSFTSNIKKAGGTVQFDVLLGRGHRDACDNAYNTKRLKWLFSQVKNQR